MKKDYSDRSIYKSLQLKNDCLVLNDKTIVKKNIYLQNNIITVSNKTIDPENLNLIQRVNNDSNDPHVFDQETCKQWAKFFALLFVYSIYVDTFYMY